MKTEIHPNYYVTDVICACGNQFVTRSTQKQIKVEICGACHPFYTGKQRLVDTAGRVERFQKRFAKTGGKTVARKPKKQVKKRLVSQADKTKRLSTAPKTEAAEAKDKAGKKGGKKADKKA